MKDRLISHYRILGKLGEGGMGQVYLAEDTRLERKAALKLLQPRFASDPERMERFRREAKTVASLNHPNIVTIYSVEETDGGPFLTMELVEGRTLTEVLSPQGLAPREFFEIALPLADALSAAHQQGVTHRDLKPGNIMVGDDRRVKILDFGLAKLLEDDADSSRSEGHVVGTLPYISPEQAKGGLVDTRSDIFSLGVVLYEMATGERPFRGETPAETISSILQDSPPPVTDLNAELPRPLARVIRMCLEKNPADRFQTVVDVRNMLRSLAHELGLPSDPIGWDTSGLLAAIRRRSFSLTDLELGHLVTTRSGLSLLLVLFAALNWVETSAEGAAQASFGLGRELGDQLGHAMRWLEAGISFERHDVTNLLGVYGASISYFFVFPLIGLGVALTLIRRRELAPFRVFSLATVMVYLISLPFFVFFPVPERWSHHASEATLLSDLWSSQLIETIRPISGLDNCFPSFHVSLTAVIILCCYLFRVRMRTTVLFLGLSVVLSTFLLGIHWIADIVAGLATGALGVCMARRLDAGLDRRG